MSRDRPAVIEVQPSSPRYTAAVSTGAPRKIAIPVDLSDESAYAVRWAVQNYLRPGDAVTLIHVRPTSVLYGADWGSTHFTAAAEDGTAAATEEAKKKKLEDDFENFTAGKLLEVAEPLTGAKIGYKVHVVKDHDMKERLCLEIERLGMSAVIMGSRGFGASSRRNNKGRLGSVSDYCVHHCVCPVVVVRFPDDSDSSASLHPVPEEEPAAAPVSAEAETGDVSAASHLHAD